jgi:biofilm PGA synthesis lipoprotein PgaB
MRRCLFGSILILITLFSVSHSQGQEKPLNAGALYDSATELYHKGRCEEAIKGFSKIIDSLPTSTLVSYSQYMIGLCCLKLERYEEALRQFELYLKTYPDGDRVKEAEKGMQISKERIKTPLLSNPKKVKRRICAQVFDFEVKNLNDVEKRVKALKSAGVNTLLLRVFQNKGHRKYKFVKSPHEEGVYFKTEYAPIIEDILGELAEIAHRNGLDVFAWMNTRYANYGLEGKPEYGCRAYNFETKKMEVVKGYNLFYPNVLSRLEGLFRDLGRYPIDGILLQDDLVLRHNEDFSMDAGKAFLKEFGYSPHPDLFYIDPFQSESGKYYSKAYTDRFWSWANWKNRWLMHIAQRLMEAARESNPNLQFAINLYYETILNKSNGVAWFSQTLSEALEKNFDYYAVMAYHRQTMKELKMDEKKAIGLMAEVAQKAVKSIGDPSRVLMKVQILDWRGYDVIPQKEVEEVLTGILEHGEVSLAFVPYMSQFPLQSLQGRWSTPSN